MSDNIKLIQQTKWTMIEIVYKNINSVNIKVVIIFYTLRILCFMNSKLILVIFTNKRLITKFSEPYKL